MITGKKKKVNNWSFYGIWKPVLEVAASADAISFFLHPTIIGIVDYYLTNTVLDVSMNLALVGLLDVPFCTVCSIFLETLVYLSMPS